MDYTRHQRQIMDNLKVWQWGDHSWLGRDFGNNLDFWRWVQEQW
jgi:hypothetical protein